MRSEKNNFTVSGTLFDAKEDVIETKKNGPKPLCRFMINTERYDAESEDFVPCQVEFTTWKKTQIAKVMCCADGDPITVTGYLESRPDNDGKRWYAEFRATAIKTPQEAQEKAKERLSRASDGLNYATTTTAAPGAAKDDMPDF